VIPLSLRLIREIHEVLLSKGRVARNSRASSGEARIGSAAPALGLPLFRGRRNSSSIA
jgi:hypothetical protein